MTAALEELYTLAVKPLLAMSPLIDPTSTMEPGVLYLIICRAQLNGGKEYSAVVDVHHLTAIPCQPNKTRLYVVFELTSVIL